MLKRTLEGISRRIMERTESRMECDACGSVPQTSEADGAEGENTSDEAADFGVRTAESSDLSAARELIAAAALPTEGVAERFEDAYAVAVSSDGGVVGVAGLEVHGTYGLLRSVAVDPTWRGRGVGAELTAERLGFAAERGLDGVYLLTTTAADYFPRFGFEPVERESVPPEIRGSSEFSSLCPSTAAVLALEP